MDTLVTTVALLTGLALIVGTALFWANRRFRSDSNTLIDAIDALLPQTQCAQCGYPGCRPYAAAIATGEAINLCPPGGTDTHRALGRLLASSAQGRDLPPPTIATHSKAVIDESRCIGCYLCIEACPVDAIIGAHQFMHTVIEDVCTGCELCIAPCPVDCISLVSTNESASRHQQFSTTPQQANSDANACIRCGRCEQQCPVDLLPQELLWHVAAGEWDMAHDKGMDECIECGLCNPVCPSDIDLVGHFRAARIVLHEQRAAELAARQAKERFTTRSIRLAQQAANQAARREQRLDHSSQRKWQS
ncbi:MAG: electron transport complex subunit RsxB [Gammaproteobacteria bacterium]|nr:electron transport complex subunit RsxB [Gammaproteobacteria bacterium]MCZ6855889.1 electron transport complex subunit RsxB [Gammaproteobacteria bacterium]